MLIQYLYKFISTKKHRIFSFYFQTPCDSCTSHYPVSLVCLIAHLLFSLLTFLCYLSLVANWYEWLSWEHPEPWYLVPHLHWLLPFKKNLPWCGGTWSIIPWQPLITWFSIEHHSSLDFFVVIFLSSIIMFFLALLFSGGVNCLI